MSACETHEQNRELCKTTLESLLVPATSVLGKLLAGARLRETPPEELTSRFEPALVDEILGQAHLKVFRIWLNLSLRERTADAEAFLSGLRSSNDSMPDDWSRIVPAEARSPERELFVQEVHLAAGILLARATAAIGSRLVERSGGGWHYWRKPDPAPKRWSATAHAGGA